MLNINKIFLVSLFFPFQIFAESVLNADDILILEDPTKIQEATSTYAKEIYTDGDIENSGSSNLFDFLSQHTSLNILPSYGDKTKPLIDMRGYGIESGYQNIIITLDGQRLNNIDMSSQLIGSIPLQSIKKIEVIRGSGSVKYGDGAMAGVINIITKDYAGAQVKTTFGSAGQEIYSASYGYTSEYINFSVDVHDEKLDGYSDVDTLGNKDKVDNQAQNFKINLTPLENLIIKLGYNHTRNKNFLVGALTKDEFSSDPKQNGGNTYANYDWDVDKYSAGLDYAFNKNLSLSIDYYDENKSQNVITTDYINDYDYDSKGLNIAIPYATEKMSVTAGIQIFDGSRKTTTGEATKDNKALFIDTEYRPDILNRQLLLSAGIRIEQVEYTWQDGINPLKDDEDLQAWDIGLNYQINNELNAFINYNRGFQAPDVDRFFKSTYGGPPLYSYAGAEFNAFIDPAESDTVNLGFNHVTPLNQLQFNLFYSKVKDEIVFDPTTYINTNIDNSKKYGVEIFNNLNLSKKINLNVSYNFVKAEIGSNSLGFEKGKDMPGVPNQSIIANINYKFLSTGNVNINHVWKESAYNMADFDNNGGKQPAFISTNLSINYAFESVKLVDSIKIFAAINNIFEHENGIQTGDDAIYPFNFTRTWITGIEANF